MPASSETKLHRRLSVVGGDHQADLAVDADLARAAQSGDPASLGVLLSRHRARLLALALQMLRQPADAEDAVQEAALIALTRIGELRDPAAVGGWLRTIVRNCCLMRLRVLTPLPSEDIEAMVPSDASLDPQRILEQRADSDWVWHAIEELSPPLRTVTLLRYFAGVTSSQDIGALCGIPAGTVRSRLAQARAKLAENLLASATTAHADVAEYTASRRREAQWTVDSLNRGEIGVALRETWQPTVEIISAVRGPMRGFTPLIEGADRDLKAGVQQRLTDVVASRDILIYQTDLISPADDPEHCPPGATWLLSLDDGRVSRFRLFHAQRPEGQLAA